MVKQKLKFEVSAAAEYMMDAYFFELLQQAGYKNIECKPLTFGISTIYIGEK